MWRILCCVTEGCVVGDWKWQHFNRRMETGKQTKETIRYFLKLVATGSFSPERGLPTNFCVDFNHFQSIVMSALVHSKTLECSFLNNFSCSFTCYQRKTNLLKSSLGICCLKMIKMYKKLDRKSPFTYAATW